MLVFFFGGGGEEVWLPTPGTLNSSGQWLNLGLCEWKTCALQPQSFRFMLICFRATWSHIYRPHAKAVSRHCLCTISVEEALLTRRLNYFQCELFPINRAKQAERRTCSCNPQQCGLNWNVVLEQTLSLNGGWFLRIENSEIWTTNVWPNWLQNTVGFGKLLDWKVKHFSLPTIATLLGQTIDSELFSHVGQPEASMMFTRGLWSNSDIANTPTPNKFFFQLFSFSLKDWLKTHWSLLDIGRFPGATRHCMARSPSSSLYYSWSLSAVLNANPEEIASN